MKNSENSDKRTRQLAAFSRLLDVVETIRAKCPWDSVQTYQSLRPNTIEEVMELAEALLDAEEEKVRTELGDVLLHVLLYALIADGNGAFDLADVCNTLRDKLVFRHPHIFGNAGARNAQQVKDNWELLKMREKHGNKTVLGGVPRTLPSLIKAERIQEKAANVGFDWPDRRDVWAKVREEADEVEREMADGHEADREKEFGDLLFAVVNAARLYGVRADNALERTNRKFIGRFNYIESQAKTQGRAVNELTLAEMDALWDEAKKQKLGE